VEKGQECGLGLDVKFEVLPDDIMEAVVRAPPLTTTPLLRIVFDGGLQVHSSRLQTIEEVWGDGR